MAIYEGSFTDASSLKVGIVIARFNDLITNKILFYLVAWIVLKGMVLIHQKIVKV